MKKNEGIPALLTSLRVFTAARIAIGRVGSSMPLQQSMELKLAHAHARDAVYSMLDVDGLTGKLAVFGRPMLHLRSQASTRHKYLKRPDLGRLLDEDCKQLLSGYAASDIAFIIADGLAAEAVNENACGLLQVLIPQLLAAGFSIAPLCLVEQGRVAIGDDIAAGLNARLSVVLIGERPGLSAADSMGAYLTYSPRPGLTDESRNCVSNIRKQGLDHKQAAARIFYLITEAFSRKLSGVQLKDNAGLLQ